MIVNNNLFDLTRLWLGDRAQELHLSHILRDTKDGWSPQWPWKDWRYAAILEPALFTVKAYETEASFTTTSFPDAVLWLKTYKSAKGGKLHVTIDGREMGSVSLNEAVMQGMQWDALPLGALASGTHTLRIRTEDGEHVIARMVLASSSDVESAQRQVTQWLSNRPLFLGLNFDFRRASPAFTSVHRADENIGKDLLTDTDVPVTIPVAGTYAVALNQKPVPFFIDQEQKESDSYQTIERGKTVAQTFTISPRAATLEGVRVTAEVRDLTHNTPADIPPEAPLNAILLRTDRGKTEQLAQTAIAPAAAGVHDAWKQVEAIFNVPLDPKRNGNEVYTVIFSSETTKLVWAVSTVSNGFRGKADHYPAGYMLVKDKSQAADLAFAVTTRSAEAPLKYISIDGRPLPSATFTTPWVNRVTLSLTAGPHVVSLRGVSPFTEHVQLMFASGSPVPERRPFPGYTQRGPVQFSTNPLQRPDPYLLIFNEAFDPDWKAVVRRADGSTQAVPEVFHVRVHGYANGWWIIEPGMHWVDISYSAQRFFQLGLVTMALTTLGLLGVASWEFHRWRENQPRDI